MSITALGPIAAYAFSVHEETPATIFAVFCVAVNLSDTFLKPLLLGRGVEVSMLVILLGAIVSGIIGLFVGAVILGMIYRLFTACLDQELSAERTVSTSEGSTEES